MEKNIKNLITEKLYALADACAFPLYVVGGFTRDFLAGLSSETYDVDICAAVGLEEVCAAAESVGAEISAIYRNTGTVKISFGDEKYEFASFRSDEYARGTHTPLKTYFTDDMSLDARRRDFKCNAVYYAIKEDKFYDPLGGTEDIKHKRITTVAEADKVFGEDGLRLMRLARQAAQLDFTPDEECILGARRNCRLIADVSAERVFDELCAILHADKRYGVSGAQYRGLKILDETRTLDYILPELTLGRGMKQNELYHKYDVLEHSLRAALYADDGVRLAALFHDIGKPYCKLNYGNYHDHDVEGARIAEDVLKRLKAGKKICAEVFALCRLHMYDLKCDARESKIRKFVVRHLEILEKLLLIKQADYSACTDDENTAPCVVKWKNIIKNMQAEGAPFKLKGLNVRGDELIAVGVSPSSVGKILSLLLEECAVTPELNVKDKLLKRAISYCAENGNF